MAEPTGYIKRGLFSFTPSILIGEALTIEVQSNVAWSDKQGFIAIDTGTDPGLDHGYPKLPTWGKINDEIVEIVSLVDDPDGVGQTVVLNRGVLDTVPQEHIIGSILWFAGDWIGVDKTEWTSGETVWAKAALVGSSFETPLAKVIPMPLPVTGRAAKPYAPGQFKINAVYWPASVVGDLIFTWAHRDRLQQVVPDSFTDQTDGNIGPEAGTTYNLTLKDSGGAPVYAELTGLTGTSQTIENLGASVHGSHVYWRIYISASNGDVQYISIAEMELKTNLGDVTGSGTADASSEYGAGQTADEAFDDNAATVWHTAISGIPGWLSYQFGSAEEILSVTLLCRSGFPTRAPKDFVIQYSDNGTDWTPALTETGVTDWVSGVTKEFFLTGDAWSDGDELSVTLTSVRDGLSSFQSQEHTFLSAYAAPIFTGTISNFSLLSGVPMDPYDASVHYTTGGTPTDYYLTNEPAWMSIDEFGSITGTPPSEATVTGVTVTGTNSSGNALSNTFSVVSTAASAYAAEVFGLTPVAYWRLGEDSGTLAEDYMGAHDGVYYNTPTLGVTGLLGGDADTAMTQVAASSEYMGTNGDEVILDSDDVSFCWHGKMTNSGDVIGLYRGQDGSGDGWSVRLRLTETAAEFGVVTTSGGAAGYLATLSGTFNLGQTYFLSGTFEQGVGVKLYIDGDLKDTTATTTTTLRTSTFGCHTAHVTGGSYHSGTLDELAIFDKVLTATEIAGLHVAADTAEYLLNAGFVADNQTFANAQVLDTAAEGVVSGSLTAVDTSTGTAKIVGNELELVGDGGNWDTTGVVDTTGRTKQIGLSVVSSLEIGVTNDYSAFIIFGSTGALTSANKLAQMFLKNDGDVSATAYSPSNTNGIGYAGHAYSADVQQKIAMVCGGFDSTGTPYKAGDTKANFTYGYAYFIHDGSNWVLLDKDSRDNTSPVYLNVTHPFSTTTLIDKLEVPDLDFSPLLEPLVLDTFTDTDGTALASHTPDVDTEAGGWSTPAGAMTIQTNGLQAATLAGADLSVIDCGEADVYLRVEGVTGYTDSSNYGVKYLLVRYQSTTDYIAVYVHPQTGGFYLIKRETNVPTTLDSVTGITAIDSLDNVGYTIRITTDGNDVRAQLISGTSVTDLSATTTFLNTETDIGVMQWGTGTYTKRNFDNFAAYAAGTGGEYDALDTHIGLDPLP